MQWRVDLVTEQKAEFFSTLYCFVSICSKADFCSANLTSEVIFFNEIVRVASSANACELNEWFVLKLQGFHLSWDLSDPFCSLIKREISQGPAKCTSQILKSAVIGLRFFPLKSADVSGAGTLEEPLRTSAWEASAPVTLWQRFLNPEGVGLRPTSTV